MHETRSRRAGEAKTALLCGLLAAGSGCSDNETAPPVPVLSSNAADAAKVDSSRRLPEILKAELQRNFAAITAADLSSRDVVVRRATARALARIRVAQAREKLQRQLHDEDETVVAWAAYGLGDVCAGARQKIVRLLATAAASRQALRSSEVGRLSAQRSITRAVGKCGTAEAERLLVAWALRRDAFSLDAIHALGIIARKNKRLREETHVALLSLAEGDASEAAMPAAFYPIAKSEHLRTPSVVERTHKLARAALDKPGPNRVYAINALGRCDERSVPLLRGVLQDDGKTRSERVAAARNLARFGRDGQEALAAALETLVAKSPGELAQQTAVVTTILSKLTIFRQARAALRKLAALEPGDDASVPVKRRLSWIRCGAAMLVAERDYKHPLLRGCDLLADDDKRKIDPLAASIGARAIVAAIGVDGAKIVGARLAAWRAYALGGDLRAREAALELIGSHGEINEAGNVITQALEATEPGLVATAAEVIVKHPNRVQAEGGVHPTVVEALVTRLDGKGPSADLEVLGTVIQAAGKLRLEKAKPLLSQHCNSSYAQVRGHAETALRELMGKDSPTCAIGAPLPVPFEFDRVPSAAVTIELETDVGKLSLVLDPTFAPIATTRALDLARNGFYDGMIVHRVVAGFVSQFGSPTADGYGGVRGLPSLPCETSPIPYGPLSVGVALAGRDTGSSQLFVTHASTPHLDGEYALIGTANGAWDELVDGDVIQKAVVIEK